MTPANRRLFLLLATAWAALAVAFPASPARAGDEDPAGDPVFRALQSELDRAKTLSMPDVDRPYFLKAFATDSASFYVSATFGAVTRQGGGKGAGLSTDVRVGSADLDNTNFSGDFSFFSRGGGGGSAPLEGDYDALRQALWQSFDGGYKAATEAIAKKRAYLASNHVQERLPDMAPAKLTDLVLPRQELKVDKKRWREIVKRVSAVFRAYPVVHTCSAWMSASVSHQYFVSTDPVRHRFASPSASFSISAGTQASDGMDLSVEWEAKGRTEADLPDEAALLAKAEELAKRLDALAKAPPAEDYWGPVMFTGVAAGTFFLETVAVPLSNPRQPLGSDSGGRLLDRLGRRIAVRTLTARDDPTQTEWNGKPLLGSFPVDDDGVVPQPITLIENGVLKTYYMSRVPTKLVAKTNGHSRAGNGSAGNLFIEAREGLSREAMEKQMIDLCRDEDLEYGILVEELESGSSSSWWGGSSGSVQLPAPSLAYRLYRDGRKELIRGATFKSAPQRTLRDILALGNDPQLLNTTQSGQPVSVVAPSVLVEELEISRPNQENSKPPYSERPKFGD